MSNNIMDDELIIRLDDISIRSVGRDICRNFWVILLMAVSAWMCISAYAKTLHVPEYTSAVTFAVTEKGNGSAYSSLDITTEMAEVFAEVFQSDVLRKKAADAMGTDEIEGTVSTEVIPETNLLKVSMTSSSPEDAFRTLKLILENYTSISDYLFGNAVLEVIQNPQIPMEASNSFSQMLYQLIAALAAALLTGGVIVLLSVLRDTVQTKQAAKHKLDGQMFGCIGHEVKNLSGRSECRLKKEMKKKNTAALISNPLVSYHFMEEYRSLCSRLDYHMRNQQEKILLISSASENEGKSTAAANLALAFAAKKKKVLLLDCDFRKPALYKVFEINMQGITDFGAYLLNKDMENADIIFLKKQGISLAVNKNGYASPQKMIISEKMEQFLKRAGEDMDYIIIDSPPMMVASDAEALSRLADASLLVVRQDCTPAGNINDCMDILRQSSPDFIGYVLNDFQEA